MRVRFWRRLAAALALVLGIGVAAPVTSATAAPVAAQPSHTTTASTMSDWWW